MSVELFRANRGLLHKFARRYARIDTAVDTDDLIQAGYIGLVEAERTYDPTKGKTWAGWAAWYIRREMRGAVGINTTRERPHLHAVSLDAPLGDDEGAGSLLDMLEDESIPDASSGLVEADRAATVRAAVERLEADRREVIRRHDLQGASYAVVGEGMGLSVGEVKNLRVRALNDLRNDKAIRLMRLEDATPYYRRVGVSTFNTTWTSATEAAALWRIERMGEKDAGDLHRRSADQAD